MSFQIKSFKELISMTKEKLEESMIPLRVRSAKAKAEGIKVEIETRMLDLEAKINTACADKSIDFNRIVDLMDDYALAERQLAQVNKVVEGLFPAE
ncbi:MAG: hypothetical protein IPJ48_17890 [Propionivibrio sp.]|jgi:hypothetical protein|uniref:Uncharacterized protein n=1 Tax=Candidatus Propionivibrio dominans TaxID=2954373 RepID=A0A9D7FFP7_9RHOO|nr:hypothetical protein [Candidatus Propionivibrio dominans]